MIFKTILADFKRSDGQRNICIYVYDKGKKVIIPTEYYVKDTLFEDGLVIKKHPNADYLNANVDAIKNKLQRHALMSPTTPAEIKRWHQGSGDVSLFEFIEEFIEGITKGTILIKGKRSMNKGKPYSSNTIKSYVTYTRYLKKFNPKLDWGDITEEFLQDYIVWMRGHFDEDGNEVSYGENTIAKAIKILCSIMTRGSKHHRNTDFLNFEASYQDVESIYLTEQEIQMILQAHLPLHLISERRRFYLSYNFFLRFGDSLTIDKRDIFTQDGRKFVRFMDEKTKNKQIIPLLPHSLTMLQECNYKLDKTTNQESNWKLKEIGKLAGITQTYTITKIEKGKKVKISGPKNEFITTHTARRSMATNFYLSMAKHGNIDLKSLQLMGGWKSIAMLEKYLKINKLQNALDAAHHPFFN